MLFRSRNVPSACTASQSCRCARSSRPHPAARTSSHALRSRQIHRLISILFSCFKNECSGVTPKVRKNREFSAGFSLYQSFLHLATVPGIPARRCRRRPIKCLKFPGKVPHLRPGEKPGSKIRAAVAHPAHRSPPMKKAYPSTGFTSMRYRTVPAIACSTSIEYSTSNTPPSWFRSIRIRRAHTQIIRAPTSNSYRES